MNRREFLKKSSLVAGAVLAQQLVDLDRLAGAAPAQRRGEMLYRPLGNTGEELSILGLGGAHIGRQPDEKQSIALIKSAIDRGITFMDNSWDYNGGESEKRMGKALQGGYREKVFLMTKFDGRTRSAAQKQIDESLKRLKTDRIDLLMFHEVIRMNDPDRFFGPDGAVQAALEAKKAGKARYLGFTGHKDPAIHLHMLDLTRAHNFKPDAVLMPLNVMDAHFRSFQHQVLPRLISEKIGVLSMKPLGDAIILQSKAVSAIECLHYAMTVNPGTVVTGIDSLPILDQALEAVRSFKPLTREEQAALLARTERFARSGEYELFKTTGHFDSTAKHPEWMG
ncbi:oxidoreductase [Geomonas silvestris]|uniref:Oxidoreductase n=1 Tax=Geomonas silvestris TaxID=2740184 RepID=A0A6V8MEG8_9BACT|nr:aldo/keto reductase [Geomonas silvestris]GFO58367.1 oxidoreductase [Geomonas silvestris]